MGQEAEQEDESPTEEESNVLLAEFRAYLQHLETRFSGYSGLLASFDNVTRMEPSQERPLIGANT